MPNTVLLIKDKRAQLIKGYVCWRCRKWCLWLLHNSIYRVILLMSEVSKVHRELSIQSNVTHIKGVESSSIYTIRTVMLCILKVLKEVQNGLTHLCS